MDKISPDSVVERIRAHGPRELLGPCVELGMNLSDMPMQPLYFGLRSLPWEETALLLPELSEEQKTICLDLDFWEKDELNPSEFEYWIRCYALCDDEQVRFKFAKSIHFALYLKARLNCWTFDDENPTYPDHDYYFITDDHLLLFEFDEFFNFADDIQRLIRDLYSFLGVEKSYSHLFKYVSAGYLSLLEDEYQVKKGRLSELGLVDYYDALKMETIFPALDNMDHFIQKKAAHTPRIGLASKEQVLDRISYMPYEKHLNIFCEELNKVREDKRKDFLKFNFIRLVNGRSVYNGVFRGGRPALDRVGRETRSLLKLGHDYLKEKRGKDEILLESFNFCELYKIGRTLITHSQKRVKKALSSFAVQKEKSFLGPSLQEFFDSSIENLPEIDNALAWRRFDDACHQFETLIPFINKMHCVIRKLTKEGHLRDHFYLNYEVGQLDFESVIISNLANFTLGYYKEASQAVGKLGVTLTEYKTFAQKALKEDLDIKAFQDKFGLGEVFQFPLYIKNLLKNHLVGHNFEKMSDEEFRYVGGPIILAI